jgi:GDPmannose 4,6-dehydratase
MKKAIITGVNGQIGSYLAEELLKNNYEVCGIVRHASDINTERVDHIYNNSKFKLVYGDLADYSSISSIVADIKPDMFFHLGAMSHVRVSFDIPIYTGDVTGLGTMRCLEACRKFSPKTKFYNAATSELFGSSPPPQNEDVSFHPRSPYGVAKIYGYWATINYREAYGMFCSNGIVFNTESPRRKETFVTRKITRAVGRIYYGLQDVLELGNLNAKRDWSHAKDTARAMRLILEHDSPNEFAIASGVSYSVQEFLEEAFSLCGLDWKKYVKVNPKYLRPSEVNHLRGDASKAKKLLNWKQEYNFKQIVKEMVEYDLELARKEKHFYDKKM